MLQGVCEIELRDEHGNVVQKTKDKNMITSGLEKMLYHDGFNIVRTFGGGEVQFDRYRIYTPILKKLIGGIHMYSDVQTEDVNNIFHDPTKIIASAGLSKKVSDYNVVGLWNIEESSIIYDTNGNIIGIKFVWDFATNKGNGTIKSVSLTTDIAGRSAFKDMGIVLADTSTPYNLIDPITEKLQGGTSERSYTESFIVRNIDAGVIYISSLGEITTFYAYDSSNKTITLKKYKLKNNINLNTQICNQFTDDYEQTMAITIDISDLYEYFSDINLKCETSSLSSMIYYYNEKIYLGCAYGKKIYLKTINPETFEVINTIKQTYEEDDLNKYNLCYPSLGSPIPLYVYNDCYVVIQTKYIYENSKNNYNVKLLFLSMSDLSIIKEKTLVDNSTSSNINKPAICGYIDELLYIFNEKKYVCNKNLEIIETSGLFSNYIPIQQDFFKYPYIVCKKIEMGIGTRPSYSYISTCNYIGITKSAETLFTIDNLATLVTKTASQTMKVIYTIKDAE